MDLISWNYILPYIALEMLSFCNSVHHILSHDTLSKGGCLKTNITAPKAMSPNKCHLFVNIQPKYSYYSSIKETLL